MTPTLLKPLFAFRFHIRRHGEEMQTIVVEAEHSLDAINSLPQDLCYWDFSMWPDGSYRQELLAA